jgi:p-cumate 2,3-dioxygenase beta subunit
MNSADAPLQRQVETLFYNEAALLDEWRLEEWLGLLTENVRYLVPPLDRRDADPSDTLFMIADDRVRLTSRVTQLGGTKVWAETPRSRTRRLLTNVRVTAVNVSSVECEANFCVWQFQHGRADAFVGQYRYRLARQADGGLLIEERRAVLDHEELRPHGKISFIL